ncbi:MazG nucleotide pyrophosphohydrolase domain-containing protein [Mycobacteroides abscessus]|uniref:MazG nucleotide pyrophosphohydrolase domain-containing protein n=1 Tax=Mycobacteroides abscessus TaxID=36809 RepID=UPI000C26B523|nr:MazG nucleotide pyrophosphohydrolase domain-containing protein [Mycobacteroides abscessus]
MDINDYQQKSADSDVLPADEYTLPLLGLAGEIGTLAAELKKQQRDQLGYIGFEDEVREELGDLMWYVAALARRCNLDLGQILAENLHKTQERYNRPSTPPPHDLFDEEFAAHEQFPRQIDITFIETVADRTDRGADPVPVVRICRGASTVGDPLDDNSDDNDDYRYHDAMHLAHMAVLGWSPTMRALLDVKRRSSPDTNRIQDGGRASAIEEGLTAYVFSVAAEHNFFATTNRVPADVIKACQRMTAHLEVSRRNSADWEYAILAGYNMFRALREHRGGTVHADLRTRTLTFTPPTVPSRPARDLVLKPGTVVVFEGLDKAGKSTQRDLLESVLDDTSTTFAHMPSGFTDFTRRLYRLLETQPPTRTLARQLAHLSCHSDSIAELFDATKRGALVLDRWWWSTLAYGWYANPNSLGISEATFRSLIEQIWAPIRADVVFVFLHPHLPDDNNAPGVQAGYEALADDPDHVVIIEPMSESDTHDFIVAELRRRRLIDSVGS